MIARVTKAYVRRYSDSGQVSAYVEWTDTQGRTGRTEGPADRRTLRPIGLHMTALFDRTRREGAPVTQERW